MTFNDLRTVMWKERKSLFRIQGRRGQTALILITPILLAIAMPLQLGKDWVSTAFSLIIAVIIPLLLVGTSVPAAFTSEREQHTLPTLLASRLSDRAIFLGKMLTSVIFAWGATLVVLLLSLVTVNIANWDGQLIFYKPTLFAADVVISLLFATLTAGLGVLFSLRSDTVQQAQQSLMAVMMIPLLLLQVGFFVLGTTPAGKETLKGIFESVTLEQASMIIAGILAVLTLLALFAANRSFQRERLVLRS
ncbi:MAG: ABC transporter permease [Anaerolineales bacterium]|nr:ABC transporter permease [Anaerolineales bacterium]